MRSITERFNIFGACITGESTIMGIARIAGFSVLSAPEFTANVDTDIEKKCTFVLEGLENHDLVVVHFKGPDICGHDGKPEEKRLFLEREDRALGKVLEEVSKRRDCYIALTGDHSTPCEIGEHTADPVPCVVWGRGVLTDEVTSYGERSCQRGGLGRITANQFLLTLLDLMDVTFRFGT
jgi:2,3-bisphosphoglycerate-independent phosphoglycerate mutase